MSMLDWVESGLYKLMFGEKNHETLLRPPRCVVTHPSLAQVFLPSQPETHF